MRLPTVLALAALVLSLLAPLSSAQCDWDLDEAWVSPGWGDDATGAPNDPTFPYRTIQAAIDALDGLFNPDGGIVHCLPGLYGNVDCANGEQLPIQMRGNIHVQGFGAKECVLRGDGSTDNYLAYYPTVETPTQAAGSRELQEILVDFSFANAGSSESPASFDGFTLQGGDVQVYVEAEGPASGVVSNCVFDMRDVEDVLDGPDFGVLTVAVYDFTHGGSYWPVELSVLNNTFIQGRVRGDTGEVETADVGNVAICDTNDPRPFWGTAIDPDPRVRGVSPLNIQNNVIRSAPGEDRTALLGLGSEDVTVSRGTVLGPTNAFDATLFGGLDVSGQYESIVLGLDPVPAVDLGAPLSDPAFVGEMIENRHPATNPDVRDWRILPDSVLVDEGSAPVPVPGAECDLELVAGSGTAYVDHIVDWPASVFLDWDGDGHGNPRVVGAQPDIGMHETDLLTVAGSYGNDSKSHHLPGTVTFEGCLPETGSFRRVMIQPVAVVGPLGLYGTFAGWAPAFAFGIPAWTVMPCSLAVPAPLAFGDLYLDLGCGLQSFGSLPNPVVNWVNPLDGAVHTFRESLIDFDENLLPIPGLFFHEQAGVPVLDAAGVLQVALTNLQSEFL